MPPAKAPTCPKCRHKLSNHQLTPLQRAVIGSRAMPPTTVLACVCLSSRTSKPCRCRLTVEEGEKAVLAHLERGKMGAA